MTKKQDTFATWLHCKRLELSIQRKLLMSQQEMLDHIMAKLGPDGGITIGLFTLRQYENGSRLPPPATKEAIIKALS